MFVNATDPNLASLASDAAVELDLMINGEYTDLAAVKQLGASLDQSLIRNAGDSSARGLQVDTETETILGRAFIESGDDPSTILGRLFSRTEQLAEQLATADPSTEKKQLEFQRAFCLALSQSASAYRQMIYDARQPHPHRR